MPAAADTQDYDHAYDDDINEDSAAPAALPAILPSLLDFCTRPSEAALDRLKVAVGRL